MELMDILKELPEEKQSVITAAIEAEKNRGIQEARKKGEDAKKLLTERNNLRDRLKDLGVDPEDSDSMQQRIDELKEKISGKKANTELEQMKRDLKKMQEFAESVKAEKAEIAEKLASRTLSDALRKAFGDRVHAKDYVINGLIRDKAVKLAEDGETPVFSLNGSDVEIAKGVEEFLKANPNLVVNRQNGSGSGSGGGTHNQPKKTMPQSEWLNLDPKARAVYIREGGTLT
jgi:hypothetical protein